MADYPQPPYGFPPPPPNMGNQLGQNAFTSHSPHAPPAQSPFAPAFPGGIPGLNMSSFTHNTQQAPFPQWPPAPPIPQQNAYGLPFPPPLPPHGFAIPPPPPPLHGFVPPPHALPNRPAQSQPQSAPSNPPVWAPVSDREEGEVSDSEGQPTAPCAMGPANSAPASAMVNRAGGSSKDSRHGHPQNKFGQNQSASGSRRSTNSTTRESATISHNSRGPQPADDLSSLLNTTPNPVIWKRSAAKNFVQTLHQNNIGFATLAREGLDAKMLRSFYDEMGLPVPPPSEPARVPTLKSAAMTVAPSPAAAPVQVPAAKAPVAAPSAKPAPVIATSGLQSAAVKPAPSPVDRKDYIARLQALKKSNKPSAAQSTSQEPAQLSAPPTALEVPSAAPKAPASAPLVAPAARTEPPATAVTPQDAPAAKSTSAAEAERKTALIRERLQRLKAAGLAKGATPSASSTPVSKRSPKPEPPASSPFSKIPGLFMNSTTAQVPTNSPSPVRTGAAPPPPKTFLPGLYAQLPVTLQPENKAAGRKRPVASDFDDVATTSSGPTYTRPLGQSPHEHDSESLIIEVSDDESDGSDMDLDDTQVEGRSAKKSSHTGLIRNGAPTSWSGLPPRPGSSALNTPPGARTPGIADNKILEEKDRTIQIMKLKIAEMERKKKEEQAHKAAAASAKQEAIIRATEIAADAAPQVAKGQSTATPQSSPRESGAQNGAQIATLSSQPVVVPVDIFGDSSQSRKRRAVEAQAAVRALDDEHKRRTERLAEIQREMEELMKWKDHYQIEKERLQKDLEEYGVDTEGMTNDEMQAEKDRIVSQAETSDPQNAVPVVAQEELAETAAADKPSGTDEEEALETADSGRSSDVMEVDPNGVDTSEGSSTAVSSETTQEVPALATTTQVQPEPAEERSAEPSDNAQDGEDFYSPPPFNPVVSEQSDSWASQKPGPAVSAGLARRPSAMSEEGEVAMSESSTEDEESDYAPEEADAPPATSMSAVEVAPESDGAGASSRASSSSATSTTEDEEKDGEVYEPPEPEQLSQMSSAVNPSDEVSGAQPVDADQTIDMDVSMSDSDDSMTDETAGSPEDSNNVVSVPSRPSGAVTIISDDLAPELQPSVPPAAAISHELVC